MFCGIYPSLTRHYHLYNTELVAMLLATASVAQLAEHLTRFRVVAGSISSRMAQCCIFRNRSRLDLKKYQDTRDFPPPKIINLIFIDMYASVRGLHTHICSLVCVLRYLFGFNLEYRNNMLRMFKGDKSFIPKGLAQSQRMIVSIPHDYHFNIPCCRFPLLHQLNITISTLDGFFIFMHTLNSQREWNDKCSD